jgi:glycosyl transferase family 25
MELTTYIINLQHREDRRQHIISELTKLEISNFQIVDGIQKDIPRLGCSESHIKCIQLAKENKLPYVLILEDDAVFTDNIIEILNNAFAEIQTLDWDMLFLGANLQAPTTPVSPALLKLQGAYTTHAYIVHRRFYDIILNLELDFEIDVCYSKLMATHNIFMCNPMIAYQLPSHSDLQDGFRDYNQEIYNNYLRFKP